MPITIRELTEIPYLRTHLHAGGSGAENAIAWAHSIELRRPWEWLEPGDLLMTIGLGVPPDAEGQVEYVEQLARAGVSGVAIAEGMQAPPISRAMCDAADRVGLPLLFTAHEVPFVQVSRTVAAAGSTAEHGRLVRAARIYDQLRATVARAPDAPELLAALEREVGCALAVCANGTGAVIGSGERPPSAAAVDAFRRRIAERDGLLPGITRLTADGHELLILPVPARRPSSLLAVPSGADVPPFALLQHVAAVAALEVERLLASREELRRLGSETLASLLDGQLSPASAALQLQVHGLESGPYLLLAGAQDTPLANGGDLHHLLAEREVPSVLLQRGEVLNLLLPADEDTLARCLETAASDGGRFGVSDVAADVLALPRAAHEARWALETATSLDTPVVRYAEGAPLFGPRSVEEARYAVERVLGALIAYDAEHETEFVPSLRTFLRCNRSWQRATAELFIHKQTLVYRMRRVEELTGRSLSDTADVAELWLATQALDVLR